MATKRRKHDHTHRVIKIDDVWKCALPDCIFFMYDRQARKVMMGRNVICWSCGEEFPMDEDCFKLEQPVCMDCRAPGVREFVEDVPASPRYGGL